MSQTPAARHQPEENPVPFELLTVTKVAWTNVNPRPEFHGEEHVRAIDLSFRIEGSNELLDTIEPGLLIHHYTNNAAKKGQDQLPEMVSALPNLRHPKLPTTYRYAKDEKPRGYRLEIDSGLGDRNLVLDDCVRGSLVYETIEGGTVRIGVMVQYNGDELTDDAKHGRLCGLAGEGFGHILLWAPAKVTLVKGSNWRSGKPDTPPPTDGGAPLLEQQDQDEVDTPEKALAASVNADLDQREKPGPAAEAAWPFPNSGEKAKRRKATGAAA
jgi:hypothetical protein